MNKKILICLVFFIFSISNLCSSPIVVRGYGTTYKEATNNSLVELSSFISTEVSSVMQSSILVEGEEVKQDSFSDDKILSSYSKLIGVEYNKKQDLDGLKCVEATIPDSREVQVQYKNHITDILAEINKTNSLLIKTNDDSDKLQYLEFILSYIKIFKSYKFIMLHLNDTLPSPQLDLSETALKVQYINLLNKQQDLLDDEISNLQFILSEKEQQQSEKLNRIIAQRDKITKDREKAIKEEEKWRQGVRDSKTAQIIQKADALKAKSLEIKGKDTSLLIPSENPLTMIKQIETKVISYENSCESVLKEIKTLRLQVEDEFFTDKYKIKNRKLSIAEKTNGKETEQSKQYTQYLIDESKKALFNHYKKNRNLLVDAVEEKLKKDYEIISENIEELNNTNFVIDSRKDNVNITIGQYDGAQNKWPVVIDFIILDKQIEIEFGLGYEDFTQRKIPSIGENGAYSSAFKEYIEQVDVLEAYFADLESDPISIKLQYSISGNAVTVADYPFSVNKMIVTRNDNNEQIIKALLSPNQIDDFKYSTLDKKLSLNSLKDKIVIQDKRLNNLGTFLLQDWNLIRYEISYVLEEEVKKSIIYGDFQGTKVPYFATPQRFGYKLEGWYTDERYQNQWYSYTSITTSDITLYAKWNTVSEVGSLGQAGGYIFYDKGEYSDGWRYLEAAPYGWYNGKDDPRRRWTPTLDICYNYYIEKNGKVYDDWFLPSQNMLNAMYYNLKTNNLGGFYANSFFDEASIYWSSTSVPDLYIARGQFFHDGLQTTRDKSLKGRVRPVRSF